MTDKYQLDTLAVRAGIERSQFGEHSEALLREFGFDDGEIRRLREAGAVV